MFIIYKFINPFLTTLQLRPPGSRVARLWICKFVINKQMAFLFHNNYCFYFQNIWIYWRMWQIVAMVKLIFALEVSVHWRMGHNMAPVNCAQMARMSKGVLSQIMLKCKIQNQGLINSDQIFALPKSMQFLNGYIVYRFTWYNS